MRWGMSGMSGEIAEPIDEQLARLRELGVARANLTKLQLSPDAPARSIDQLGADELAELQRRMDAAGVRGYCVTPPVGKYPVDTDSALVERQLQGSIAAAKALGARFIRVFSFAPRAGASAGEDRDAIHRAFERLVTAIEQSGCGAVPLLENNYRMYASDGPSTAALLGDYAPGRVALAFDAHACVVAGARPYDEVWPQVEPWVRVLHLKDYAAASTTIVPVGQGDGQLRQIIAAADPAAIEDLALEPHLHNSAYGKGRDKFDLFREARDAVLAMLDAAGKPRPAMAAGAPY